MTEETLGASPEDAPVLAPEVESADSSPAPVDNAEPVVKEADDAGQPRDEEGKFLSPKAQKRIDQLTWEKNQREREAEYWRQEAIRYQQQKSEPPKVEEVKLPSLESVGYDEAKYQAALIEYATKQARAEVRKELDADQRQRAEQQRMETFATRQTEFAKANPDYQARIADPTLPITEAMRDVIVDSPTGPELAYYLAQNRETAEQIARLPAHLAALELGRIDGRLSALKEVKKAPPVTKAPPPPPKVDDVETPIASVKASDSDSDKLSTQEWFRLREKELKRKKG
jgi:type II secretory pathway pseudopilin PulG